MKHIDSQHIVNRFSKENEFAVCVDAGEVISVDTRDCFDNRITGENQTLSALPWESINPCTGPIMVKDAHVGDVLKIDIIDIQIGPRGVVIKDRGDLERYGALESEKSIIVDIEDGKDIVYRGRKYRSSPMIGVIGVLTDDCSLTTLPGINGGNMDNTTIIKGSSVFLPVIKEGAGVVVGDLHAAMGDGETTGCGVEVAGMVTLRFEIMHGSALPLPFVETKDKYITVASAATLDLAVDMAAKNMRDYLLNCKHMESDEAWLLLTVSSNIKVCQIANKLKTARCELNKKLI